MNVRIALKIDSYEMTYKKWEKYEYLTFSNTFEGELKYYPSVD